jgi:hypothetical protein
MRDVLETQLAESLRAVADGAPAELEPPADLELRVARARRSRRLANGLTAFAVAAVIAAAVGVFAVVQRAPAKREVTVASTPTHDRVSLVGRIKPNVVMLDARDHYVVALDRDAHAVDTLVVSKGKIIDAQIGGDHTTLWYLVTTGSDCGKVVRVDIGTGSNSVVQSAEGFAISPDGHRLAYVACGSHAISIRNLDNGRAAPEAAAPGAVLEWTPDGSGLVVKQCSMSACTVRYGSQSAQTTSPWGVAVGGDGVYVGRQAQVYRLSGDAGLPQLLLDLDRSWRIEQVVPTRDGLFFFAQTDDHRALFRVDDGHPVNVSTFAFGTLTPVLPLHQ